MEKIRIVITDDGKYGILHKDVVFDINTFNELSSNNISNVKSGKLHNLPLQPIDKDFISKLKSKFPYTKIGRTYAFHLNWIQKFFIRINENNTMNIYSGYPVWILKRLLSFINREHRYQINDRVEFMVHYVCGDEFYTGVIKNYTHDGNYEIIPDDYEDCELNETEIIPEDDIIFVVEDKFLDDTRDMIKILNSKE